jgi:hypothetical protein
VTDHLEKTTSGVVVVVVSAKVFCERVDASCEDRDLNFGRTCVAFVCLVSFNNLKFFVFEHHSDNPPFHKIFTICGPWAKHRAGEDLLNLLR